jgi:hypothetical protein
MRGKGAKGIHNLERLRSKMRGIQTTVKRVRLETYALRMNPAIWFEMRTDFNKVCPRLRPERSLLIGLESQHCVMSVSPNEWRPHAGP